MDSDGKDRKRLSWETKLQLVLWGIVLVSAIWIYWTQASMFGSYYGAVSPYHESSAVAIRAFEIQTYSLAEYCILILVCLLFEPWFACKQKSVKLSLIFLLVAQIMVRATTRYGIVIYRDVEYMSHQSFWYIQTALWVCVALIAYRIYCFYRDMRNGQRYMAISRSLVVLLLVYVTVNTFYDRYRLVAVAKSRGCSLEEKFSEALNDDDVPHVEYLLTHGLDINSRLGYNQYTPLMFAVRYHWNGIRYGVIRHLLSKDGNLSRKDKTGNTTLHLAVIRHHEPEVLQMLLSRGVDINVSNAYGQSALGLTLIDNSSHRAEYLRNRGAHVSQQEMHNVRLVQCCQPNMQAPDVIRQHLLDGANPDSRNIKGETALMLAVLNDRLDIAKLLLQHGADPNLKNQEGKSALALSRSIDMMKLLIDAKADVDSVDCEGMTPIMNRYGPDAVTILVDAGADLGIQDATGRTPLHHVCSRYDVNSVAVKKMLTNGADPNVRDSRGWTPLFCAIQNNEDSTPEIVNALIRHGANAKITNKRGQNVLFLFRCSDDGLLQKLIDCGADPTIRDCSGKTASYYMKQRKAHTSLRIIDEAIQRLKAKN